MKRLYIVIAFFAIMVSTFTSCKTPSDITYFQDMDSIANLTVANPLEIKIRPEDKLSIVVKSKDPALADLFNLAFITRRLGYSATSAGGNDNMSVYTVDADGMIDFPVIGMLKVAGLSRREISNLIKNELISRELVKDPTVTVEYDNMYVSVLGEVNNPGRYNINRDRVTILDVIGMAGDLTIYGKRQSVVLIRNIDGKTSTYRVDLTKIDDVYRSPAYNIQQNDVVYVEPNDTRARQSTVNGNNLRSTSFWISLASLLTSMGVLIVNIID
jgi:polysaccharide export outer membrane protein